MKRLAPILIAATLLLVSACGSTVTTQVVPVQTPLPASEEAAYSVQDKSGNEIGRAVFRIEPAAGDAIRLTQDYEFGEGQVDRAVAVVERDSLRPLSSERLVQDEGKEHHTAATYAADSVTVTFTGERGERSRTADISETTYDNLESLFLWRTLPMEAGESVSYINVVVDPRRGTISRALATVSVAGREQVKLPSGSVEAWRLDFSSAGVTNQAWYAADGGRRLVKYVIDRGPTLVLENASTR
jgi:hypothetical protein